MRLRALLLSTLVLAAPAAARATDPATGADASPATVRPETGDVASGESAHPALDDEEVAAEAGRLSDEFAREVPSHLAISPENAAALLDLGRAMAEEHNMRIDRPQTLLLVDRNPAVQAMALVLARPDGEWTVLGATRVSTGKPGRKEHFKTPTGVMVQDGSILGYRAEGTYNEIHIRGLGLKGMRVWDFGWQETEDWKHPGATARIRLEMHATDPANLEHRIGRPDSEGCVRIPAPMNRFLDHRGIIDADLEAAAAGGDRRFAALLPRDRQATPLAGDTMIVVDSSEK